MEGNRERLCFDFLSTFVRNMVQVRTIFAHLTFLLICFFFFLIFIKKKPDFNTVLCIALPDYRIFS